MKKILYSILSLSLLLGGLSLSSCSSDEEMPVAGKQGNMLQITTDILETRSMIKTGTSFSNRDTIGLVLTGALHEKGVVVTDVSRYAVYNGSYWTLSENIDLSRVIGDVTISAYYPYHHDGTTGLTAKGDGYVLHANPDGHDYLKTVDVATVNWQNPVANLKFSHLMSRITLNIQNDAAYPGDCELASTSIYPFIAGRQFAIAGKPDSNKEVHDAVLSKKHNGTKLSTSKYNVVVDDYLVFPQNISECYVRLKLNGDDYEVKFPNTDLKSGYQYTFNIAVQMKQIPYVEITAGQIKPWTSSGSDYALEENVEKPNISGHEYIDFGLPSGTLWATCNVGATAPQETGYYIAWGEIEPKTNGYTWQTYLNALGGKMDSWKDCDTDFDPLKGIHNIGGNKKYDAATAQWGEGWRMPTQDELLELISVVEIAPSTLKGKAGYTLSYKEKSIFIPAAGYYDNNGLRKNGDCAKLWACTQDYVDDSGVHHYNNADILTIGNNGLPSQYSWGSEYRCYGLAIRPVANKTIK